MNVPAKIVVVDDDPKVLQGTMRILEIAGFEVLAASSGQECLELVQQNMPDLVMLDVVMADMEGTEVCRRIKDAPETKRTFVVLVSGSRISSDQQADGLDVGADGYITRPFTNREFLSRVDSILRIKKAEDDLHLEKEKLEQVNAKLTEALSRVKRLEGILPICVHCHKIRDVKESWQDIVEYIGDHSDAVFSHGLCPECMEKHYPDEL